MDSDSAGDAVGMDATRDPSSRPTVREVLPGYFPPDRGERQQMIADGLIAIDTNVLLDLYRYTPAARANLAAVLSRLGERLFVPFQVALEFQQRRFNAMQGQRSFFKKRWTCWTNTVAPSRT